MSNEIAPIVSEESLVITPEDLISCINSDGGHSIVRFGKNRAAKRAYARYYKLLRLANEIISLVDWEENPSVGLVNLAKYHPKVYEAATKLKRYLRR